MNRQVSSSVRIGLLVLAAVAVAYGAYKSISTQASGADGYSLRARFRDATGLPINSRVVIAGLPVGEIVERRLDGRFAQLTFRVHKDAVVYENAVIRKKASSLLGEYYLDVDPGTPESPSSSGVRKNLRLQSGQELTTVIEAASTDDLIRQVNEAIPRVEAAVAEARGLFADTRSVVNGPIKGIADNVDRLVHDNQALVEEILDRVNRAAASFERIGSDLAEVTGGGKAPLLATLKNAELVSVDLRELVEVTRGEIESTGDTVRQKLDRLDRALDNLDSTLAGTASVAEKIDGQQGTLGKLINDPDIADNVESLTDDLVRFSRGSFGLKSIVGLRTEWHVLGAVPKAYFSLELAPQPDKFYYIEIVDDPRGTITEELVLAPGSGTLLSSTRISRRFRWSLQFAKKIENYTFRIGVKESAGGIGVDARYLDGRLWVHSDVYEPTFNHFPRLKFRAALNFFKYLYIYAGIDDVLNPPVDLLVHHADLTGQRIPYHYGRDMFGGVMFRFSDEDLAGLLFMGGSAISGAASSN
ncbi:MAG: MlaD family protein [Proteobacteria bacterium]|nr:MlaD family protein [Pseudomonadota bacterium]